MQICAGSAQHRLQAAYHTFLLAQHSRNIETLLLHALHT